LSASFMPAAWRRDTDIYAAQQHGPLLDVDVPT
jgi:hypothetical protein